MSILPKDGGFLKLQENEYPQKSVHKEFYHISACLQENDFSRLKKITENYINKHKCHAILKSGSNEGYQCSRKIVKNNYCNIHQKYANMVEECIPVKSLL